MVSFFKGGPVPSPCPDCPPAGPRVAPGNPESPAAQPILKGKSNAQKGDSQNN
jgi:hypothetical protein